MILKTLNVADYIRAVQAHCRMFPDHRPNFLMSEYWMRANGWEVYLEQCPNGLKAIQVMSEGHPVLPSIYTDDYSIADGPYEAGFARSYSVDRLWDRQYVYLPSLILDGWQGGQFRGRRKALSLALRNLGATLQDLQMVRWDRARDEAATEEYLSAWAADKADGIYDPELLVSTLLGSALDQGEYEAGRATLLVKGKPLGIVMVDRGIKGWLNFRYCLVAPNLPGLSELCRMMVWHTTAQRYADVEFINDGGCLDSPGLEQFKDKLNPAMKLYVPTNSKE